MPAGRETRTRGIPGLGTRAGGGRVFVPFLRVPPSMGWGDWRSEVKDPERFDATYKSLCEKLKSKGVEIKDLT